MSRERAIENLRSAFMYFKTRPATKFDIIDMAKYNTKDEAISNTEWLALFVKVRKEFFS